ncbi:major facilitator transporter [Caballeronia hypogeia]|uniref:Major facilitator transporter n=1 Tax=Caballeronia hypogeia TaxID=1777140 RepID=A0A158ABA8_9BURK|nr:MFS transporter [Caballeronia hypogeia]SAK55142.1 major facilitator transporter [Caballeronia hypogeia]
MNSHALEGVQSEKRSSSSLRRLIVASSIGNALEWFDIVVYGYFAVSISKAFFPAGNAGTSILLAYGTFGISYIARPVGALWLGAIADRVGRKHSMLLSIGMMMVGTLMIATMPTYAQIGLFAPVGILVARLIQGVSAGGEFGSSTALLVENDPKRRGFLASFQFASQGFMTVMASLFGLALSLSLSHEQVDAWGWRIPFFFGLLVGPVGLYIRRHVEEGTEFKIAKRETAPLKEIALHQKGNVALAIGTLIVSTVAAHVILYMPVFAVKQLHLPSSSAFSANLVAGLVLTFGTPFVGILSDKLGRTRLMVIGALAFVLTVVPAFYMLKMFPGVGTLMLVMFWLALVKSVYFGALPALMAEAFPPETRATGMALSYNIGTTVFGGFTPFIVSAITIFTASDLAPALYLVPCALLSLAATIVLRHRLVAA